MPLAEVLAILMVLGVIAALMAGYQVALTLAGDEVQAGKLLSADLPQDKVSSALAGYAALKVSAK